MSQTGNRTSIYEKIDALHGVQTLQELVARLHPILTEMAYYTITGDGAVQETHEEWHTTFTDNLYSETSSDIHRERRDADAHRERREADGHRKQAPRAKAPLADGLAAQRGAHPSMHQAPLRAADPPPAARRSMPTRAGASSLPATLRSIMDGTHASLHES